METDKEKLTLKELEKGDKVSFWDFENNSFVQKTATVLKVRNLKPKNYKVRTESGEIFYKWKDKLTLIND